MPLPGRIAGFGGLAEMDPKLPERATELRSPRHDGWHLRILNDATSQKFCYRNTVTKASMRVSTSAVRDPPRGLIFASATGLAYALGG